MLLYKEFDFYYIRLEQPVDEVTFISTSITGDVDLFVSKSLKKPGFESKHCKRV